MLTFISNLIGVKADKAMQTGIEALVRWDPQLEFANTAVPWSVLSLKDAGVPSFLIE